MKTKKTLGQTFLEAFLNLREKDPIKFGTAVSKWLSQNKIEHTTERLPKDSLIETFFSDGLTIKLQKSKKRTKAVIIGKGVCFDTGGYDIKPTMLNMHFDRNGALLAIASSIDTGVDAAVFFVNNMIHTNAPVHGDILLEPITNQRVLIDNTDAEGRIGLAHLLASTNKHYKKAITLATLTGAAVGFTGERTMALVHSNKPSDYPELMKLALTGNEIWPAPFHPTYDASVNTKIVGADIASCGTLRQAGSSTAFSFLKRFFNGHLLHVDMAAMDSDANNNAYLWGLKEVRSLLRLVG